MKVTFTDTSANQYDASADEIKLSSGTAFGKLYIGDRDSASFLQLRSRKCLTVVNCAADMHGLSGEKDVKYLNIDPENSECFEESFNFIRKALSKGKNVVVQCQNGLGKSAVIVLYFLMRIMSFSMADSHKLLKQSRKNFKLNIKPELVIKLIAEERKLRGDSSICLDGRKIVYLDSSRYRKSGGAATGFPIIPCVVLVGFVAVLYGTLVLVVRSSSK